MASAMSQVQQMRYIATFPLLLNIADQPTYFMSLKGEDGLVKMYAMVNVQQYSIVSTGSTVAECEANYRSALAHAGLINEGEAEVAPSDQQAFSGTIAEIRTAVMDGNSYYFIRLKDVPAFFRISAAKNPLAVILNVGDTVTVAFRGADQADAEIINADTVARGDTTAHLEIAPEETPTDPNAENLPAGEEETLPAENVPGSKPVEEQNADTPAVESVPAADESGEASVEESPAA